MSLVTPPAPKVAQSPQKGIALDEQWSIVPLPLLTLIYPSICAGMVQDCSQKRSSTKILKPLKIFYVVMVSPHFMMMDPNVVLYPHSAGTQ